MAAIDDAYDITKALQVILQKERLYEGKIDGKLGTETYDAIALFLKARRIDPKGWNYARLAIAGEQIVYRQDKIDVGLLDGKVGPLVKHAREVYKARLVETWRDKAEVIKAAVDPVPAPAKPTPIPATTFAVKPPKVKQWPRQAECTAFFGKVGTRQGSVELPYPMRIAWDKKNIIKKFSAHELVCEPIERIFKRTLDYYGMEKIKDLGLDLWGGCLNVRKIRGGSGWSMHSWGIAVDMDPDNNQLKWGRDRATFSKPAYNKYWEFVYDEGAISLGKERNYDWMHYQFARL